MAAAAVQPKIVFQKECAITRSHDLATLSFGPCYVLTGHDPKTKTSFLAHIDDTTDVGTLPQVFDRLRQIGVNLQDLTQVRLMGGWAAHGESARWGDKIVRVLHESGLRNVDFTFFQKKAARPIELKTNSIEEGLRFYYPGGILRAADGKFISFKKPWFGKEKQQVDADKKTAEELILRKYPQISKAALDASPDLYQHLAAQLLMSEPDVPLTITVLD